MLSKARIKHINTLKLAKFRRQFKQFTAEGTTNVLDFIENGLHARYIYALQAWIDANKSKIRNLEIEVISESELKKITNFKTPSEVFAVFEMPEQQALDLGKINDLVLVLDDIRDPGNLGTIIRTADWFGIRQIICSKETVDLFNPKVVQASMGSVGRVKLWQEDLETILDNRPPRLKVFGAVLDGKKITNIQKPEKGLILIGNESRGINSKLLPFVDEKITIPATTSENDQSAESLNASIATAIICYELRRKL